MKNRRSRIFYTSSYALAGWLFADLLLGLAMIFLISNEKMIGSTPIFTPNPSANDLLKSIQTEDRTFEIDSLSINNVTESNSTPTYNLIFPTINITNRSIIKSPSSNLEREGPPGLAPAQCYNIQLNSAIIDHDEVIKQLWKQIPNKKASQAGLVLIWTHGESIHQGVEVSRTIGEIIRKYFPLSFENSVMKSLGFFVKDLYFIQLEIFFYTDTPWYSGGETHCLYNQ